MLIALHTSFAHPVNGAAGVGSFKCDILQQIHTSHVTRNTIIHTRMHICTRTCTAHTRTHIQYITWIVTRLSQDYSQCTDYHRIISRLSLQQVSNNCKHALAYCMYTAINIAVYMQYASACLQFSILPCTCNIRVHVYSFQCCRVHAIYECMFTVFNIAVYM